jgi:hypothetical protein
MPGLPTTETECVAGVKLDKQCLRKVLEVVPDLLGKFNSSNKHTRTVEERVHSNVPNNHWLRQHTLFWCFQSCHCSASEQYATSLHLEQGLNRLIFVS